MTPLCELALKHGTDKARQYTPFYHEILGGLRERVRKVLELGIGYPELMNGYVQDLGIECYKTGASLYMWRDYFPNAEIVGLDMEQVAMVQDERITSHLLDERFPEQFAALPDKIGADFDLIVDDGLHEPWAQMNAIFGLMPLLAEDGIYIMEDVMEHVDLTRSIPYPCKMKEFGISRVMVVRKPKI